MADKLVTFRCDDELLNRMIEQAERDSCSLSSVVRRACIAYYKSADEKKE